MYKKISFIFLLIPICFPSLTFAEKEAVVLMPMRGQGIDKAMLGSMESALVKGLQGKYKVFSGNRVSQKVREIFERESKAAVDKDCDETRCMQDIAIAFQSEFIATAIVLKRSSGYVLTLNIKNIFDDIAVYSESIPCEGCNEFQVLEKLKTLAGGGSAVVKAPVVKKEELKSSSGSEMELAFWNSIKDSKDAAMFQAYLNKYPVGTFAELAKLKSKQLSSRSRRENNPPKPRKSAPSQARKLTLRERAEGGDARAQFTFGDRYYKGKDVTKDYSEAARWFRKAAEQGHASAQQKLGLMLQLAKGVTKDSVEAVRWYRKSADQGHRQAQNNLAIMYEFGAGGLTKDYNEAIKLFRRSAEQGFSGAQNSLGEMYEKGQGVTKNNEEAVRWYRKSAKQNHPKAKKALKRLGK